MSWNWEKLFAWTFCKITFLNRAQNPTLVQPPPGKKSSWPQKSFQGQPLTQMMPSKTPNRSNCSKTLEWFHSSNFVPIDFLRPQPPSPWLAYVRLLHTAVVSEAASAAGSAASSFFRAWERQRSKGRTPGTRRWSPSMRPQRNLIIVLGSIVAVVFGIQGRAGVVWLGTLCVKWEKQAGISVFWEDQVRADPNPPPTTHSIHKENPQLPKSPRENSVQNSASLEKREGMLGGGGIIFNAPVKNI